VEVQKTDTEVEEMKEENLQDKDNLE